MPRPRKAAASSQTLHPGQAAYVVERLIRERRVSASDVARYVVEMQREITELEERLNRLREAHGGGASSGGGAAAPVRRGPGRPAGSGRGPGRPAGSGKRRGRPGRPAANTAADAGNEGPQQPQAGAAKRRGRRAGKKSALSGEQLASRQLQGRYLALVRQFPENKRTQYAKTAKEKGREVAIREMQDALKK